MSLDQCKTMENKMKKIALAFAAAATVSACTGAAGHVPSNMTAQDQAFFDQAVMRTLKDPSTAQVRNVKVYQRENGARMICGSVNGKNSFGAFSGFQVMMVATAPGIDYSKPFASPVSALGGLGAIDCAGLGYQV